jgi:proline utilization trans-activator
MGLHLNVPELHLNDPDRREHRCRVWWTAYILDRMWAANLGQVAAIEDKDIQVDLPTSKGLSGAMSEDFGDPEYINAMIRLARVSGDNISSLYGRRKQEGSFSQRVQRALRDLRCWVGELPQHLQLSKDQPFRGIGRQLSLHLSFNQVGYRLNNGKVSQVR